MRDLTLVAAFVVCGTALAKEGPLAIHDPNCTGHEGPAAIVHVTGFKDRGGNLRVELYPATTEDFLAPGRKLVGEGKVFIRIDIPTPEAGEGKVCVPLPAEGAYAMAVLHDRNASGRLDPFSDGYGFPNNPRLGYKKPPVAAATFSAAGAATDVSVVLNYWSGFSARPIAAGRE